MNRKPMNFTIPVTKEPFPDEIDHHILPIVIAFMGHDMRKVLASGPYAHYSRIFEKLRDRTLAWFNTSDLAKSKNMSLTISIPNHHGLSRFTFKDTFNRHSVIINLSAYASHGELFHASSYTYL